MCSFKYFVGTRGNQQKEYKKQKTRKRNDILYLHILWYFNAGNITKKKLCVGTRLKKKKK